MKFRFRFSLLSLVCFVLLAASAGTLWWNCEAWEPAFTVKVDLPVWESGFVPGRKYFWVRCSDKENPNWVVLKMYELPSGRWVGDLHCRVDEEIKQPRFSPDGKYAAIGRELEFDEKLGGYSRHGFWRLDGLSRVGPGGFKDASIEVLSVSPRDRYAVLFNHSTQQHWLVTLPDMKTIAAVNSSGFEHIFSRDEQWMATRGDVNGKHGVIVYAVMDGRQILFCETRSAMGRLAFSPASDMFAVSSAGQVSVFDTANWKLIRTLTGMMQLEGINGSGKVLVLDDKLHTHLKDVRDGSYDLPIESAVALLDENTLVQSYPHKSYDIATKKLIFDEGKDSRIHSWKDGRVVLREEWSADFEIRDTRSGAVTSRFRSARWPAMFATDAQRIAMFDATRSWLVYNLKEVERPKGAAVEKTVWRLVRPNLPWDAVWMGEFWLTVFFGVALGWSLKR